MVAGKPYEHQTDSWSLVVLTYELLIGSTPFHCINQMEMYKRIELADYHFPPIPLVFKNAKLFISGLLKRNPSDRMSLEDASNTLRLVCAESELKEPDTATRLLKLLPGKQSHKWRKADS